MESNGKYLDVIEDHIKQLKNKNLSNYSLTYTLDRLEGSLDNLRNITDHEGDLEDADYYPRRIEDCAILLWNLTVVRKSADLPPKLDARMRQVACDIMGHVKKIDPKVDTYFKRRLQMTVKTVKSWLSCGEPRLADVLVQQALECIRVLHQFVDRQCERGLIGRADREKALVKLDEDLMKVHLYRAEACCMLEKFEAANAELDVAEKLLNKHPQATCILAILCYNMGVACYHKHQYQQAITFLRRAVQFGVNVDSVQQGRTLRLLTNCYLDWGELEYRTEALEVVDMANRISVHASGLYLRIRILMLDTGVDERVLSTAIHTLMENGELSSDVAYKAAELLLKNNKLSLALKLMRRFVERFPRSVEVGRVYARQVVILVGWREYERAEHVASEYLKVVDEKFSKERDAEACEEIWRLCKDTAAVFMEKEDYQQALRWFDHCVRAKSRDQDPRDTDQEPRDQEEEVNLAKVQRDRATCLLYTEQLEKAWQALELAERHEPTSPANQYLRMKVALARFEGNLASDAFLKMCLLLDQSDGAVEERTNGLISLTAQLALEPGWRGSVLMALRRLSESSSNLYQVIVALRCLTRLYNQSSEPGRDHIYLALGTMETAYEKLKAYRENLVKDKKEQNMTRFLEEVDWFVKTAWNMAVQSDEKMTEMYELYSLCNKLIALRGHVDQEWLVRKQTCSFMAAAAALDLAKTELRIEEKRSWLEEALSKVNQCRDIQKKLQGSTGCTSESSVTELVLLLEFETKAWLRDPDMERTFVRTQSMENIDPKTLEKMAVVCHESRCADKSLSSRILSAAIERYKRLDEPDFVQISKLFLFLIDGSLNEKLSGNKARDNAWKQYSQLLAILSESGHKFPEIDIVSFMAKAWNVGQDLLSRHNMEEAEKWCSLGLKLVQYLRELKPAHEPKMNEMYGGLLKRFKKTKCFEE